MNVVILQIRQHLGIVLSILAWLVEKPLPPLEQELVHNKLEPRRESRCCVSERRTIQFIHECLELVHRDPLNVTHFIRVHIERNRRGQEKNVVDCGQSEKATHLRVHPTDHHSAPCNECV